uniref:protein-tyrosine-phosphatase n=1 Tax=Strigamia maritima TaxID=126957 RepID=T1IN00_STRMM
MKITWFTAIMAGCLFWQTVLAESDEVPQPINEHNQEHNQRIENEMREETTSHDDLNPPVIDDLRNSRIEAHLNAEKTENPLPIVWQEPLKEHDPGISQQNRQMLDEIIQQEMIDNLPEMDDHEPEQDPVIYREDFKNSSNNQIRSIDLTERMDIENHVLPLTISSHLPDRTSIIENDYDTRNDEREAKILSDSDIVDDDDENRRMQSSNEITQNHRFNKNQSSATTQHLTKNAFKNAITQKPSLPTLSSSVNSEQSTTTITYLDKNLFIQPDSYIVIVLNLEWSALCQQETKLRATIAAQLTVFIDSLIQPSQIILLTTDLSTPHADNHLGLLNTLCLQSREASLVDPIIVMVYVESTTGRSDSRLTLSLGHALTNHEIQLKGSTFENVVMEIHLFPKDKEKPIHNESSQQHGYTGIVAAFIISGIAGASLLILSVTLLVLRFRHVKYRKDARRKAIFDTYSLDSISIYSSIRRDSLAKHSYLNLGFGDPCIPSHRINLAGLANFCVACDPVMEEEFQSITNPSVKLIDEEIEKISKLESLQNNENHTTTMSKKLSSPKTRSVFVSTNQFGFNLIRGHKDKSNVYLTCKTPQGETVQHFWKMVWDQEIRVIMMLANSEDRFPNCALYYPTLENDSHKLFGDYQITLKKQESLQHYTVSQLQIRDLEKNLIRDITHFWYTSWTSKQMPTNLCSILALILEARACFTIKNSRPMLVHCSNGAERSGTLIAIDLCMKQFEESRTVDIPFTVYTTRQQCLGAICTFQHYSFIYKVINEYATRPYSQKHFRNGFWSLVNYRYRYDRLRYRYLKAL